MGNVRAITFAARSFCVICLGYALVAGNAAATWTIEQFLENPVSIESTDLRLDDMLTFLTDTYDVNFAFDWRILPEGQRTTALDNSGWFDKHYWVHSSTTYKLPMRLFLSQLLTPLTLTYIETPELVLITSRALKDSADLEFRVQGVAERRLPQTYLEPISVEFDDIRVRDILEFMRATYTMPLRIDWATAGLTEQKIPRVALKNVRLYTALKVIALFSNAELVLIDDSLIFTTRMRAAMPGLCAEVREDVGHLMFPSLRTKPTDTRVQYLRFQRIFGATYGEAR